MKRIIFLLSSFLLLQSSMAQTTFEEGFETWPLTGWELHELGDALFGWRDTFNGTVNVHTGEYAAYASINNDQCDNWMVSPPITVSNADYTLKFWEKSGTNDIDFYDSATVLISSGSDDPTSGDFVSIFETELNTDDFEERSFDLSAYDGETIYVAYRYQGTYHRWYIDDMFVGPEAFVDGALTQVENPTGVSETPATEEVTVTVLNNGTTELTDFTVSWQVNSIAQPDAIFSGLSIEPGQDFSLDLGDFDFNTEGYFNIEATLNLTGDFDSSNDMIESTYEISSFKDVGLVSITPFGLVPNAGNTDVHVEVLNVGENTIDDIEIEWMVDDVAQTTFASSSLNIEVGASMVITIGQFDFDAGLHTISATLNALGDINQDNDNFFVNVSVETFYESFEGEEFPPEDWSITFGTRDGINFGNAADGEFYYVSSVDDNYFGVISDTILTPLLDIASGDQFEFYIKSSLATPANYSLVWKDGITGEINFIQDIEPSPGFNNWALRSFDISAAAGANHIGIIATSSGSYGETRFDAFSSDASLYQFDNDLKIRNGDMYFLALQNQTEEFECKIRNAGSLAVMGADYTLKLMEEPNIEIASVGGMNLASWEEGTLTVNAALTDLSNKHLYFEIDYADDQNVNNNTSLPNLVGVVPSNSELSVIGSPDIRNANFPFTPNGSTQSLGEDDMSQLLYYSDEFNSAGYAHGIAYQYDNLLEAKEIKNYPLKVWITQSSVTNLEGGWLPQDELILVFDGLIDILPGKGRDLYIPFDEPILLNGINNVVIQNYQYDPSWPPAIFRFLSTNMGGGNPIRTIAVADVFDLNPATPPEFFNAFVDLPFTRFVIEPITVVSVLSGTVFNSFDNSPLENVTVSVPGTSISATTDEFGNYTLPGLPLGVYDLEVALTGFQTLNQEIDLNSEEQTQDYFLDPLEEVELIGQVVGSNNVSVPLEFVEIQLLEEGVDFGQTTTDGNGGFTFPLIYGGFEYELKLNLYGYEEKIIVINPIDADIDLGAVVLDEEFISPFDVEVSEGGTPTLEWNTPKLSAKVKVQHDLDVVSFSYTNEPNENVWLGNFYPIDEITTLTSVEIQTDIYPNAEDFVTIDVFDLDTEEILASSEPFIIYADSIHTIDIPNIVVYEDVAIMVHWQDNAASTNALAVDYSDENIFNGAIIKYPGQEVVLLTEFFGEGTPNMSFMVRVNTLDDDTPITNGEAVSYNVLRGLASEFPDVSNWEMLNLSPVDVLTYVDMDADDLDPEAFYRYAVETIYNEGVSEVTFSNAILGGAMGIDDLGRIAAQVSLYPVPAIDNVRVAVADGLILDNRMEVFEVTGKHVMTIEPSVIEGNGAIIDVNTLPSGMYLLKMNVDGIFLTKKFQVN